MMAGIVARISSLLCLVCQLVPELFLLSCRGSAKKTLALPSDSYFSVPPVVKPPVCGLRRVSTLKNGEQVPRTPGPPSR